MQEVVEPSGKGANGLSLEGALRVPDRQMKSSAPLGSAACASQGSNGVSPPPPRRLQPSSFGNRKKLSPLYAESLYARTKKNLSPLFGSSPKHAQSVGSNMRQPCPRVQSAAAPAGPWPRAHRQLRPEAGRGEPEAGGDLAAQVPVLPAAAAAAPAPVPPAAQRHPVPASAWGAAGVLARLAPPGRLPAGLHPAHGLVPAGPRPAPLPVRLPAPTAPTTPTAPTAPTACPPPSRPDPALSGGGGPPSALTSGSKPVSGRGTPDRVSARAAPSGGPSQVRWGHLAAFEGGNVARCAWPIKRNPRTDHGLAV